MVEKKKQQRMKQFHVIYEFVHLIKSICTLRSRRTTLEMKLNEKNSMARESAMDALMAFGPFDNCEIGYIYLYHCFRLCQVSFAEQKFLAN